MHTMTLYNSNVFLNVPMIILHKTKPELVIQVALMNILLTPQQTNVSNYAHKIQICLVIKINA